VTKRVVIKVCGITEERDAYEAVHLGVDALGFDFRDGSPRQVDPDVARHVTDRLPAFVVKVGVFADAPLIRVLETARRAGIGVLQYHGSEPPGVCAASAPFAWYKAFPVTSGFDASVLGAYPCTTFLIDARRDARDSAAPFEWRSARTWSNYGRILVWR
jgi:phosphoribosylanthranilate isomerase